MKESPLSTKIESLPLPAASLHNASRWRRLLAQLAEPPSWARQAGGWSLSAGLATGLFLSATVFSMSWGCRRGPDAHGPEQRLDYTRLFAVFSWPDYEVVVVAILVLGTFWLAAFLPFRFTVGVYRMALSRFGRRGAMLWCTALHTALHLFIFVPMDLLRPETLLAPLAIGMLWGAWLPHLALDYPTVQEPDLDCEHAPLSLE